MAERGRQMHLWLRLLLSVLVACFIAAAKAQQVQPGGLGKAAAGLNAGNQGVQQAAQQMAQKPLTPVTKADLLVVIPSTVKRLSLLKASRRWRGGVATFIVTEQRVVMEKQSRRFRMKATQYQETWGTYQDTKASSLVHGPRAGDVRAAIAPFLANNTIGIDKYKWILYGDDDTVFFLDNVLKLVNQLDHRLPYFISDALWYPESGTGVKSHPNREAPRCLPCNYTDMLLDKGGCPGHSGYIAPKGCHCTPELLVAADTQGYFDKATGRFPPQNGDPNKVDVGWWYMMHGGAGALISSGTMRQKPWSVVEAYVNKLEPQSGDAMLTRTMWHALNVAPTDPGYGFCRAHIQMFDPGFQGGRTRSSEDAGTADRGNDPMGLIRRLEAALEGKASTAGGGTQCDGQCRELLDVMISSHIRSRFAAEDVFPPYALEPAKRPAGSERAAVYLIVRLAALFEKFSAARAAAAGGA